MNNKLAQSFTFMKLIKFTLPSTLMMVFMALYQMIDGVFVANFVGAEALSALNLVFPAISLIIAVSIMLATGGSAIIARQMGEGDPKKARESFTFICIAGLAAGILFIVVGLATLEPIIRALGATDLMFGYCRDYLFVLILTCPLSIFQMLFQNFFVTAGKPAIGLSVTVAGGVLNIILDYVFIAVFGMGVTGAAVATALGYAVPALFGAVYFALNRRGTLFFVRPKPAFRMLLRACSNGSSEMVSNLANALTTYLFNIIMLNHLGEKGVAAITIVLYAQFLLTAVFMGFSIGAAPVLSYNYGSGNRSQTHRIFRQSMLFVGIFSLVSVLISYLFSGFIVGIFSRPGTEVYSIAMVGFPLFAIGFLFAGINIFSSALFTAFSNGAISALISFSRTFVFLVATLLLLPLLLGITGVWLAVPIAEVLSVIVSCVCLIKYRKKYGYSKGLST